LILMVVCAFLLFVVFKFGAVNGATRWIDLGGASLQPSEIVKYAVVFYLAKSIERKGKKIEDFWRGVVPCFVVAVTYAGLILLEKNLSISAVIVMVTLIILFSAGAKIWHMLLFIIPSGVAGWVLTFSTQYRRDRALFFMNPWQDASGKGYQLIQSLLALGSGGIMGVGLGQSRQKAFYMPEAHTDFIFSVIGEELGLIGCSIVIALFIVLIWRGIRAAINARDTYGTIIAVGITSIIAIQAIINIAVVSGSMPVTGVPLPFISYGGSSLVVNLVAMGVLLNITRQGKKDADKK
ncbi:MAG: putative lipid II flippase FtsW, partial [Bacillota bacterium]|nr:putative lipid II flippase FtsW [Bacillota bacterium]